MKFHPTRDYLLTKPVMVQETRTQSGLHIVKNQQVQGPSSTPTLIFAEVLEAGPEAQPEFEKEMRGIGGFSVGDVVAFHPGAMQTITDGGNDFALVKSTAVVATVEDFSENVTVSVQ